ncbi:AAA family ATPase [Candidatus Microgenomates bacterium]|nr:AAA family ATPase [Candidatus Microgenomates bacterium]
MPVPTDELTKLSEKVKQASLPGDLADLINNYLSRFSSSEMPFTERERLDEYIDVVTTLPWEKRTPDTLDLTHAKQILDSNHYGLNDLKERVLEYMAVMKLKKEKGDLPAGADKPAQAGNHSLRAPILCFVGLVGTGKTTIAKSISQALGRNFVRIPFGGLGEVAMLRGRPRFDMVAEPGQIMKALIRSGAKNPVILLDEIDRVEQTSRASIMGALVEILDPEQNVAFFDSYLDYPFDLSEALFIATANNTNNIATAVLDRLEVIPMPSYTDSEKIVIGSKFLLPRTLTEAGLNSQAVQIADSVWPIIVRPLGYDAGMRTLERTIEAIVRKVAKLIVEGKTSQVQLTESNIKEYLPA